MDSIQAMEAEIDTRQTSLNEMNLVIISLSYHLNFLRILMEHFLSSFHDIENVANTTAVCWWSESHRDTEYHARWKFVPVGTVGILKKRCCGLWPSLFKFDILTPSLTFLLQVWQIYVKFDVKINCTYHNIYLGIIRDGKLVHDARLRCWFQGERDRNYAAHQ